MALEASPALPPTATEEAGEAESTKARSFPEASRRRHIAET